MVHLGKFSVVIALLAAICGGCATEKAPPVVTWLSPQSTANIQEGDALMLKFSVLDPAPERGKTEPASWRISIGTAAGNTWWTTSGTLAPPSGTASLTDTLEATWQVPALPSGSSSSTELLISALCTDGEGQTGADFGTLNFTSTPLSSSGLWWVEGTGSQGFGFVNPQISNQVSHYPGPGSPHQLVHLDGADCIVTGNTTAQGWLITNGIPSAEPAWTFTPSATTTGPIRHMRKAPFEHTGAAWVDIGWSDRCTWMNAGGLTMKTWLLNTDEHLIDSDVVSGDMIILARTDANDFRLIRYNLDNTARLESVTWTPQSAGSTGPEGKAWLLQQQNLPAALETDGTYRVWDPMGGAAPLSTGSLEGNGSVMRAGRMEDGRAWAERETGHFYSEDLSLQGTWNGAIYHVTSDRASGQLWLLSENDFERQWWTLDASLEPLGDPIPAGVASISGSVAHNRPGPL